MKRIILYLAVLCSLAACVGQAPKISSAPSTSPSTELNIPASTPTMGQKDAQSSPATLIPSLITPAASESAVPVVDSILPSLPDVVDFPLADQFHWVPFVNGLDKPVWLTHAGDGTGRVFIIEQAGFIRIVQNGELLPQPFLDITDRVGSRGFEQGLLGLAFHPKFAENGYFFINYTDRRGDTVISRLQVDFDTPDWADPDREAMVMVIPQPYANHNGGGVVFAPDGTLFIGMGDGGSAGDPQGNAQSLDSLLGKLLRLDIGNGSPYTIPQDNPFGDGGAKPEIWAYGLRNPWRFSFDALNGDLYIADVGQDQWEEINYLPAGTPGGANFGWDFYEGTHPYGPQAAPTIPQTAPIYEHNHENGCSVTGGTVYRGETLPEFNGIYLYGDYCSGTIWGLLRNAQGVWQNAQLFTNLGAISSFGEDEQQEIYLVNHSGTVFRLERK